MPLFVAFFLCKHKMDSRLNISEAPLLTVQGYKKV